MKICYVSADLGIPLDGTKGASAHVRGFVRALKSLGHDVVVITSSENGNAGTDVPVFRIPQPDLLANLSPRECPRTFRAVSHLLNNVTTETVVKAVVEKFQPELIYERYSPFAAAGSALAKQFGIPHILEVNALLSSEGKAYRKQALQEAIEFLEEEAFQHTSMIVTVSDVLREALIARGICGKKVMTVPNGVDDMFFSDALSSSQPKSQKDKTVIGFVGSLRPWHAIDLLLSAFRHLAENPRYHLLVVGDGSTMRSLRKVERELPGRITLTGGVCHTVVPAYIDEMDIAVAPYPPLEKFYFSPLKVLEYMARGKAIVATSQGQIRDLIRHGETGWLVPAGDEASLVGAIQHLTENPGLRTRLGKKAASEARTRHSWRHRVVSVLEHMDARGHPVPGRAKGPSSDQKNPPLVYTGLYQPLEEIGSLACAADLRQ